MKVFANCLCYQYNIPEYFTGFTQIHLLSEDVLFYNCQFINNVLSAGIFINYK